MNDFKEKFSFKERELADKVADEILLSEEENSRRYYILILLFLLCFIFLVSSLSFAVFSTYYNGSENNLIDVEIDFDKDGDKKPGVLLFSFNSGSNYINMKNVFPTHDEVGKSLVGNKEYFDFNLSTTIRNQKKGKMYYEIALIPNINNNISQDDVRVNLTENGKSVFISGEDVLDFSELPQSKYHKNGKVIYRNSVSNSTNLNYVFRMWLSFDSKVEDVSKFFGCRVVVDAYYK